MTLVEWTGRLYEEKMASYHDTYKDSERWNAVDSLVGKKVVVYGEGGLGDVIQFVRYVPTLKTRGCHITLHCDNRLHRLMFKVEGVDAVCDDSNIPDHDFHIPSYSLPFALSNVSKPSPYIGTDTTPIEAFDLESHDEYIKIGIAWEGNPNHSNNLERCCPLKFFKQLVPSWAKDRVRLFMLKKEIHLPELIAEAEDLRLYGWEPLDDMDDTARLIAAMNLVVAVDTSVLHLAGALNKQTVALLSERHDPRWDIGENWYPNMTFGYESKGDWEWAIKAAKKEITNLIFPNS